MGDLSVQPSYVLVIVFAFYVGMQMTVACQKLPRLTMSSGIGLTAAGLVWLTFTNTITSFKGPPDQPGASDTPELLQIIIAITAYAAITSISATQCRHRSFQIVAAIILACLGGFFFALSLLMVRPGLLIPKYFANWLLVIVFMCISVVAVFQFERLVLIASPVVVGLFFFSLAIDSMLNGDSGMINGLGLLFVTSVTTSYRPSVSTIIISSLPMLLIAPITYLHSRYGSKVSWPRFPQFIDRSGSQASTTSSASSKYDAQRYRYIRFSQWQRQNGEQPVFFGSFLPLDPFGASDTNLPLPEKAHHLHPKKATKKHFSLPNYDGYEDAPRSRFSHDSF